MNAKAMQTFRWSDAREYGLCRALNRGVRISWWRNYLAAVTRLGNGIVWYVILALLPFTAGPEGLPIAAHMGATALLGVLIYKACKRTLVRERPFVTHRDIACIGTPLDRGSFPSGHTIHATSFTIMLGCAFPTMLWVLLPLSISIAFSRVALGHHYPSDVLAGATIGGCLGTASVLLWSTGYALV